MQLIQRFPWCFSGVAVLALVLSPIAVPSASAYSGGFYDDGFYDDDWYFDYYDTGLSRDDLVSNSVGDGLDVAGVGSLDGDDEYDASEFYDDAGESGFFDV